MQVLERVTHRLENDLTLCRSEHDVQSTLFAAEIALRESNAPRGNKLRMWEGVRDRLQSILRNPSLIRYAESIIDQITKQLQ